MRQCAVKGCDGKHVANGYCRKHYMRVWKNGTLELQNAAEPFHSKYNIDDKTGCWNWARATDKDGYGKHLDGRAHRFSYEQYWGRIPDGLLVCHKCDNPSCVNPDHLFLGDHKINHADRNSKGRAASGERVGAAKLTAKAVREIRESKPGEALAKTKYGISRTHYYRLMRGEGWSEVNV